MDLSTRRPMDARSFGMYPILTAEAVYGAHSQRRVCPVMKSNSPWEWVFSACEVSLPNKPQELCAMARKLKTNRP